jgi:protein TonB
MSKLHKKCFLASAGMHVLLFLVLLVGPAFLMSRDKANDLPPLDFIPAELVDAKLRSQPSRERRPEPKPPQQPVRQPEPEPVRVQPTPPRETAPPKEPETAWKPTKVSIENAKRKTLSTTRKVSQPQPNREAIKVASTIRKAAATPSIKISTPSAGGPAFANYARVIKTIYERNWHPPAETSRDDAVVTVKIVIAKDGTVLSSRIIGRSGDGSVDGSVDATLRRVTKVPPFPKGATDSTRTYTIGFNLKARRALG